MNAIYYKGDWLFKFDEEKTETMDFNVDNDRKVEHPFGMKLVEALRMAYIDELGANVLEMPYKVRSLESVTKRPVFDGSQDCLDKSPQCLNNCGRELSLLLILLRI